MRQTEKDRKRKAKNPAFCCIRCVFSSIFVCLKDENLTLYIYIFFLCMCPFLNPTIEAVTFRLRGGCMLGLFLLPAFTRLGHECQDP